MFVDDTLGAHGAPTRRSVALRERPAAVEPSRRHGRARVRRDRIVAAAAVVVVGVAVAIVLR